MHSPSPTRYPLIPPAVPASQPRLSLNPHPLALQSINSLELKLAVETQSLVAEHKAQICKHTGTQV